MTNPLAVLVEDDQQQLEISKREMQTAGFEVRDFDAVAPVLDYLQSSTELVDLFVLDRRLPVNFGDAAGDELGDELLRAVRAAYPDARLIVFTGYASVPHLQQALEGGGSLPSHGGPALDRITVLEKHQSLEFRKHVIEFRQLLQLLNDIEITTEDPAESLTALDKRLLRRLAFSYHAVSVSALSLSGGLTGARVWKCVLRGQEGLLATVIAKCVSKSSPLGGLPALLHRSATTSTIATLGGPIAGRYINVLQIAGENPYSLMSLLSRDPAQAVALARPLWDALHAVDYQQRARPVAEICSSLIDWEEISERLSDFEITVPAGSITASTAIGLRHGDLHPGNILIDGTDAVLIDFDSNTFGSGLLDPVTILLSTLVHPESPIAGARWPSPVDITESLGTSDFGRGHACEAWFRAVQEWISECRASDREFWSLVLAFAARQLRYADVLADAETLGRVVAIAKRAAGALSMT